MSWNDFDLTVNLLQPKWNVQCVTTFIPKSTFGDTWETSKAVMRRSTVRFVGAPWKTAKDWKIICVARTIFIKLSDWYKCLDWFVSEAQFWICGTKDLGLELILNFKLISWQKVNMYCIADRVECRFCRVCNNFFHKSNIARHMKNKHGVDESVDCEICGKTLKNSHGVKDHMRRAHNIYQTPCWIIIFEWNQFDCFNDW